MDSRNLKNKKRSGKSPTVIFGKHLTIDAYGCNATTLNNMEVCFRVLNDLPAKIAMRPITTPYVIRTAGNDKKDCGGISGFIMIAESHIALHTFPAKQYLTMDVYSCSMFDERIVLKFVKEAFNYQSLEKYIIKRGLRFPKDNLVDL